MSTQESSSPSSSIEGGVTSFSLSFCARFASYSAIAASKAEILDFFVAMSKRPSCVASASLYLGYFIALKGF